MIDYGHIKYWCYKVLPLVYDDSLSYYEVLCKVTEYINALIDENKELATNIDTLNGKMENVEEWIENFDKVYPNFVEQLTHDVEVAINSFVDAANRKAQETLASIPQDYTDLSNDVEELKSQISVSVTKENGNNLFDPNASDITENAYIREDNSYRSSQQYFVSGFIPVEPGETYYISGCTASEVVKSAFYNQYKGFISTHPASDGSLIAPVNAVYLRVTISYANRYNSAMVSTSENIEYEPFTDVNYPLFDIIATTHDPFAYYGEGDVCSKDGLFYSARHTINPAITGTPFSLDDWKLERSLVNALTANKGVKFSNNSESINGDNVLANTVIELGGTSVSKNLTYRFRANFNVFSKLSIGKSPLIEGVPNYSIKYASWVEIDATNIKICRVGDTLAETTFAHGLTLTDFIDVTISIDDDSTAIVELQTNGGYYKTPNATYWAGNCRGKYWALSTLSMGTYKFAIIFNDGMKPIYLFGDSYMTFTSNKRWTYYAKESGCLSNVLLSQCSGINSAGTIEAIQTLNGNPKFALWCVGMNDPDDPNATTPTPNSLTGFRTFINWCNQRGCTPIFGTIPTTENEYNEGKNYWIRNSGYRYVDFANALTHKVNDEIVWYSDMLSEDGVHPDVAGAIASWNRVLLDFPEIAGTL